MTVSYTDEQWNAVLQACEFEIGEFSSSHEMRYCFEKLINELDQQQPDFDEQMKYKRGRPYGRLANTALWASAIAFWRDELKRPLTQSHEFGNGLYRFVEALSTPLPNCGGVSPQSFRQFQRTQWKRNFSRPINLDELKP